MPAVSTVMAGTKAGVAAAVDHANGLHDRFAPLPMRPGLPRLACTINEPVFTIARAVLLGVAAVALGLRFHGLLRHRDRQRISQRFNLTRH
jgi:ABC-2 type transport system permease protein